MGSPSETAVLRALGNPLRQRLLDQLGRGHASGADLARALGSNTGVVSYHLRELAKVGLIEIDETRGRSQLWKLADNDVRFRDPRQSSDRVGAQSLADARLSGLASAVGQYVERTDLEPEWRDAALFSRSSLELTADQLAELSAAYLDLLKRWSRQHPGAQESARAIRVDFYAFPDDRQDDR